MITNFATLLSYFRGSEGSNVIPVPPGFPGDVGAQPLIQGEGVTLFREGLIEYPQAATMFAAGVAARDEMVETLGTTGPVVIGSVLGEATWSIAGPTSAVVTSNNNKGTYISQWDKNHTSLVEDFHMGYTDLRFTVYKLRACFNSDLVGKVVRVGLSAVKTQTAYATFSGDFTEGVSTLLSPHVCDELGALTGDRLFVLPVDQYFTLMDYSQPFFLPLPPEPIDPVTTTQLAGDQRLKQHAVTALPIVGTLVLGAEMTDASALHMYVEGAADAGIDITNRTDWNGAM